MRLEVVRPRGIDPLAFGFVDLGDVPHGPTLPRKSLPPQAWPDRCLPLASGVLRSCPRTIPAQSPTSIGDDDLLAEPARWRSYVSGGVLLWVLWLSYVTVRTVIYFFTGS